MRSLFNKFWWLFIKVLLEFFLWANEEEKVLLGRILVKWVIFPIIQINDCIIIND